VSDLDRFPDRATQARQIAPHMADRRIRMLLEIVVEELEQKMAGIERAQAIDAEDLTPLIVADTGRAALGQQPANLVRLINLIAPG
jgi:hypothetical protein